MTMMHRLLAHRPPRIAMTLTLIAFILHLAIPTQLHMSLPLLAATTGLFGFGIMIRAWWLFRKSATAICPTERTTALITTDVFALTRNPMYLGMTMMLVAAGLYTGVLFFYTAAVINFAILNFVFCRYEERKLAWQYGEVFDDYVEKTRRWL